MKNIFILALIIISIISSCDKEEDSVKHVVVAGAGELDDEIHAFRQLLGDPLNNVTGVNNGRREVDWDGVPDDLLGSELPADFFNPTGAGAPASRQRGLAYVSGGQFRVSNTGFEDINESTPTQFTAFSGDKIFANIAANDWEIEFEVPGQNIGASVRGFGAVFTDVDLETSVSLEFFSGSRSLGKFFVPKRNTTTSHSFLGVYFPKDEWITSIKVHHEGRIAENSKDISDGGTEDLIALDDFFYDEPMAR
jgi:hypothetical protein